LCTVYVGDLALLIDTSHPMIRPGLEKGIDAARKIMQTGRGFCLQVDTLLGNYYSIVVLCV